MSLQEISLWGIGVAITVICAVLGFRFFSVRNSQIQKTGMFSKSIQSGRDTNVRKK